MRNPNTLNIEILNDGIELQEQLVKSANNDELVARIFYNRGISNPDTVRQMLDSDLYNPTSYREFSGMGKALKIIGEVISNNRKIAIYGDYDVDGVTSTVVLFECLSNFTNNLIYHVPDRFTEGYGMNAGVVKNLAEKGVSLIITCDCGISNVDEIQIAQNLGMQVIITDHHKIPDVCPKADVLLNPKFMDSDHRAFNISGCAMAYYLCCAVYEYYELSEKSNELLDLVALSLIADVVPLTGENRYLLKIGLPLFFNTKRQGLLSLFETIGKNYVIDTEEDIAFQVAPRINAAGRMHSARLPVELLLTNDKQKADELAKNIDQLNTERKRVQQEIIEEAKKQAESSKLNKSIIVLYNEFWHHGIIGIAAGKIAELYMKPAILLSLKEDNQTVVGSARSIEGISIYDIIKDCSRNLLKFGGHSQAAGLSLNKEKVNVFIEEIEKCARNKHRNVQLPNIKVDMNIDLSNINEDMYESIRIAGPYGEGFRAPLFLSRKVSVISDRVTEKKHHIMVLGMGEERIQAVKWFGEDKSFRGKEVDFVYKLSKSRYNGLEKLQLTGERLSESTGEAPKVFDRIVIDVRNGNIETLLEENKEINVFCEGIEGKCVGANKFDRTAIKKAKSLLLLSLPPNIEYLREIVAYSNPEKLYINFSVTPRFQFKEFIIRALGLIKYIANNNDEKISIEWLAMRLCIEDVLAKILLKYLKESGKIIYSTKNDILSIQLENKTASMQKIVTEKIIKKALKEKHAFCEFMKTINVDKFLEYLND